MKHRRFAAAVLAAVMIFASGCAGDVTSETPVASSDVTTSSAADAVTTTVTVAPDSDEPVVIETEEAGLPDLVKPDGEQTEPPAASTATSAEVTTTTSAATTTSAKTTAATTAKTTAATTASATAAATTASTKATTTAKPVVTTKPAEKGVTVTYTVNNSWQEGGKECTQLDFTVKNNGSEVSSWKLTVDLGQNVEVMQSWNVNVTAGGTKLTVSNVEYNGTIPAGGETTFGVIVKTSSALKGGTASGGSTSAPVTTTATAAATTYKPAPSEDDIEVTEKIGLVSTHGQLSVKGTDLVDKNGRPFQLRGVSTHGIQWFPAFANKDAFRYLRDEWNINVIRLAMYSGAGEGYTDSTKAGIEKTVQNAVDYAIELDMYVIVDWHVLQDQSPQVRKADALRFFGYMSEKYADCPNIIYEICNEPNGYATWSGDIKPYAEEVIPVIRKNDPDSVIIVGTPTWSQDIDKAMADPLKYDNIMYALHYYAATHTDWLRDRLRNCHNNGLPVMVTEFGNCDASGNGSNDFNSARKWLELLDSLNISYMNWSLCDKAEAASLLKPGASSKGGWSDSQLSENGKFMRDWFVNHR